MKLVTIIFIIIIVYYLFQVLLKLLTFFMNVFLFSRRTAQSAKNKSDDARQSRKRSSGKTIIDAEFKDIEKSADEN